MLTYETIITILLGGAERTGLNIQFSQEQIDPHTMSRTFSMTCLPTGVPEPRPDVPYATMSFIWDAALTAISVMGSESMCDLYHDPDETCPHNDLGCAYNAEIDIDVMYEIPLSDTQRREISNVPTLARSLQIITSESTHDQQPLDIDIQMQFTSTYHAFIGRVAARQQWTIDEPLHEEEDLQEVMREICRETVRTLNALAGFETPHPLTLEDEAEPLIDVRTYLRPPTA
ncbi:MAG: hypothetical protein H0T53_01385 [Herpetosiphonaceae bacterium]|nr:hypothetical protein [Herpetosiphonaceae bacterium]